MSNHFSAANLKHPGDDPRLDITDLFVFPAPDKPDRTVLIMDSNPFTKGNGFHPDAVYRFNIDNDGDAVADVAFSFTFSEVVDGRQSATANYATDRRSGTPRDHGFAAVRISFRTHAVAGCVHRSRPAHSARRDNPTERTARPCKSRTSCSSSMSKTNSIGTRSSTTPGSSSLRTTAT